MDLNKVITVGVDSFGAARHRRYEYTGYLVAHTFIHRVQFHLSLGLYVNALINDQFQGRNIQTSFKLH